MNITLVRHGQASFGAANYDQLSPLGQQQAQWLGAHFCTQQAAFDAVYLGNLMRHQQTLAGIIQGGQFAWSGQENPNLNEFDFESVVSAYLQQYPEQRPSSSAAMSAYYRVLKSAMQAWSQGQLDTHSSETWPVFKQRVSAVIEDLRQRQYQHVLLVTSGGVIAMLIAEALGLDASGMIKLNMQIRNASLSQIKVTKNNSHLMLFNAIPHLEHPSRQQAITYS